MERLQFTPEFTIKIIETKNTFVFCCTLYVRCHRFGNNNIPKIKVLTVCQADVVQPAVIFDYDLSLGTFFIVPKMC